jgi:hypothetical protein
MARYYAGTFTAEQVSAECQHHIKVEPVKEVTPCVYAKFAGKNLIGPSAPPSCCFPFKAVGGIASLGSRSFAC